jgi:hypothetical protein
MPVIRFTDPDNPDMIREVETTLDHELELMVGGAVTWTSPAVPDEIGIEPAGQLVERERARPPDRRG